MQTATLLLAMTTITAITGMQQKSHREEKVKPYLKKLNTTAFSCS